MRWSICLISGEAEPLFSVIRTASPKKHRPSRYRKSNGNLSAEQRNCGQPRGKEFEGSIFGIALFITRGFQLRSRSAGPHLPYVVHRTRLSNRGQQRKPAICKRHVSLRCRRGDEAEIAQCLCGTADTANGKSVVPVACCLHCELCCWPAAK